jgi:hypothetical protein
MSEADRQLVEAITEQVIKLLRAGGPIVTSRPASTSTGSPVPHTAPIQPPIGVCTGDYSKFPELAGKLYGSASPASLAVAAAALNAGKMQAMGGDGGSATPGDPWPAPAAAHAPKVSPLPNVKPQPPAGDPWPGPNVGGVARGESAKPQAASVAQPLPLSGIITANQLQEALDASPDGVAYLAPNARLTPLANDLARTKKEKVRRAAPPARELPMSHGPNAGPQGLAVPPALASTSSGGGGGWLWWIEGGCPVVRDVTQSFGLALRAVAALPNSGSLPQVVRELARAVKSKQAPGGVLFVPTAARAVCLANRCASLRAIVGTSGEAVEQGIRDLGANVLIIEYPHHGHRSVAAMLARFMQQIPGVPPSVERELVDMQRCV